MHFSPQSNCDTLQVFFRPIGCHWLLSRRFASLSRRSLSPTDCCQLSKAYHSGRSGSVNDERILIEFFPQPAPGCTANLNHFDLITELFGTASNKCNKIQLFRHLSHCLPVLVVRALFLRFQFGDRKANDKTIHLIGGTGDASNWTDMKIIRCPDIGKIIPFFSWQLSARHLRAQELRNRSTYKVCLSSIGYK